MKRVTRLVVVIAPFVVMLAGCVQPPVYTSIVTGKTSDMIVDSNGTFHVLFSYLASAEHQGSLGRIIHAYGTTGSSWTFETVADSGDSELLDAVAYTIGAAPDGTLYAFYFIANTLNYAVRSSSGTWAAHAVTTPGGRVGPVGSVAFDAAGAMHVSHSHFITGTVGFDNLRPDYSYLAPGGSTLTTTQVSASAMISFTDLNYGRSSDIAIDSTGKVHMVFGKEGNVLLLNSASLFYASIGAAGGVVGAGTDISDSGTSVVGCSIAIGAGDVLNVVFNGYQNGDVLRYIRSADGGATWDPQTVVDPTAGTGYSPSLAVDGTGKLHVGYLTNTGAVKYASKSGTADWAVENVGPGVEHASLALKADGTPCIVYGTDEGGTYAEQYMDLHLATRAAAGGWSSLIVMGHDAPQ